MSVISIVARALDFYALLIFAYVLLSWFPVRGIVYEIYQVLGTVCEPYINIFRRIVPVAGAGGVGMDFSPLVALLVLQYILRPVLVMLLSVVL